MTVSRALSGNANVKPETRERIRTYAHSLGYVPSQAALAIRGDASQVVGLLLPNIENEFYAGFANAFSIRCAERNVQLMIGLTQDDPDTEMKAITRLLKHQVMSMVMVPSPDGKPDVAAILANTPTIQLIRHRNDLPDSVRLAVDEQRAFSQAVRKLTKDGCKRIAFVGGSLATSSSRGRLQAFELAMKHANITVNTGLVRTGVRNRAEAEVAMRELSALALAPDAVVTAGFEISNGVLKALLDDRNQHVRFVGYGYPNWYRWLRGGVSSVAVPMETMIDKSMELISATQKDNVRWQNHIVNAAFVMS